MSTSSTIEIPKSTSIAEENSKGPNDDGVIISISQVVDNNDNPKLSQKNNNDLQETAVRLRGGGGLLTLIVVGILLFILFALFIATITNFATNNIAGGVGCLVAFLTLGFCFCGCAAVYLKFKS